MLCCDRASVLSTAKPHTGFICIRRRSVGPFPVSYPYLNSWVRDSYIVTASLRATGGGRARSAGAVVLHARLFCPARGISAGADH